MSKYLPSVRLSPEKFLRQAYRQNGGWTATSSVTSLTGFGLGGANPTEVDNASALVQDGGGTGLQQDTSGVINNEASATYTSATALVHTRQMNPIFIVKFALLSLTDVRFYAGIGNSATQLLSNDNGGTARHAGVQFSTNRGDLNFQFISGDGIAPQQITDSGVIAAVSPHAVRGFFDDAAGSVRIEVVTTAGLVVGITHDVGLPSQLQTMTIISGIETLAAAVKSVVQYHAFSMNTNGFS